MRCIWMFLIVTTLLGCASFFPRHSKQTQTLLDQESKSIKSTFNSRHRYVFNDLSGQFLVERIAYQAKRKIYLQWNMSLPSQQKLVEERKLISDLGYARIEGLNSPVVRPFLSQFDGVFEGESKFSQLRMNLDEKNMIVTLKEKYEDMPKVSAHKIPGQLYFCFFSQVPECLKHFDVLNSLMQAGEEKGIMSFDFWIIWDSFPYNELIYNDIMNILTSAAQLRYDGSAGDEHRFSVDLAGQLISYHFHSDGRLLKLSWIAQGMSLVIQDMVTQESQI